MRKFKFGWVLYFLPPALAAVSPLIALPVVAAKFGPSGWTSLLLGQSVGALGAVLIELGWASTGPVALARAVRPSGAVYAESLQQKSVVALAVVPISCLIAFVLAPDFGLVAALAAASMNAAGFSASWLYVGLRRPALLLTCDSAPRVGGTVLGAGALLAGTPLVVLPVLQLSGAVLAAGLPIFVVGWQRRARVGIRAQIRHIALTQGEVTAARIVSTVYVSLPLVLLAASSSSSVLATYAGYDRVQKFALAGLAPLTQLLQGWVPRANGRLELQRRVRRSVLVGAGVGTLSGIAFAGAMPLLLSLLFKGQVEPDLRLISLFSVALSMVVLTRCTGTVALMSLGRTRALLVSILIGSVVSFPVLFYFANSSSAIGVVSAVLLAEAVVLGSQLVSLRKVLGRRSETETANSA